MTIVGLCELVEFLDVPTYRGAGLNALLAWWEVDRSFSGGMGQCEKAGRAGLPWHAHIIPADEGPTQQLKNKVSACAAFPGGFTWLVHDEPYGRQMPGIASAVAWIQQNYPDMPVWCNSRYSENPSTLWDGPDYPPGYNYDRYLADLVDALGVDIVAYDAYPFRTDGTTRTAFWSQMMKVRAKALQAGIPYWAFIQSAGWDNYRLPSESDLRMHGFLHLTAGFTGIAHFVYGPFGTQLPRDNAGLLNPDLTPSVLYPAAAAANAEIMNLGYCLRFLTSTAVRYVPGRWLNGTLQNPTPSGMTKWSYGAGGDGHITNVSVDHSDPKNYGLEKDGLIGFFADDAGQQYFLLTNLWHAAGKSAAETPLPFVIDFDSSVNELLVLDRETGRQEVVPLANRRLSVTLPGGTGNLYRYNTGEFAPSPRLAVNKTEIDAACFFDSPLPDDWFTITREGLSGSGARPLNYTVTDDADWLEVWPSAGSSSGEADTIQARYNKEGLRVGKHTATITVSSAQATNSPQRVMVNLTIKTVPPDRDGDTDVDQEDFGQFQRCLTEPGKPTQPGCEWADFDLSGFVDQNDCAVFRACLSGPYIMSNSGCIR